MPILGQAPSGSTFVSCELAGRERRMRDFDDMHFTDGYVIM